MFFYYTLYPAQDKHKYILHIFRPTSSKFSLAYIFITSVRVIHLSDFSLLRKYLWEFTVTTSVSKRKTRSLYVIAIVSLPLLWRLSKCWSLIITLGLIPGRETAVCGYLASNDDNKLREWTLNLVLRLWRKNVSNISVLSF